jgi:DHA1 family tetracycline resistance protein-like MFS transporter
VTRPLLVIFLTIFVNLIGFGIIIPLLPFYAETFGASPLVVRCSSSASPARW